VVIANSQIVKASGTPIRVVPDDPDDDHVIECASVAHADYILTGDSHLLAVKTWKGTTIMTAGEYLNKVALK
jgi:uncharacterized protein